MVKKKFLKGKCKATFELPDDLAQGAERVCLVGDFNDWDEQATRMKRQNGGAFAVSLNLEPKREYQYRYLINGENWQNDTKADKYVPNPFNGDNSVVVT
jgi:1,4-alpha-glucan branching enzyme